MDVSLLRCAVEAYVPKGFFSSFDWNDDFSLLGRAFLAL